MHSVQSSQVKSIQSSPIQNPVQIFQRADFMYDTQKKKLSFNKKANNLKGSVFKQF